VSSTSAILLPPSSFTTRKFSLGTREEYFELEMKRVQMLMESHHNNMPDKMSQHQISNIYCNVTIKKTITHDLYFKWSKL
jgi:hypothetical protein